MRNFNFKKSIVIMFLIVMIEILNSQQKATTQDGKNVILKNDGTWEYEKNEEKKDSSYSFRKTKWGMSKNQVKKTEKTTLFKDEGSMLAYSDRISGIETLIIYVFIEDKLVRARYSFTDRHTNKNDNITDYKLIKEILVEKYGKPKSDDTLWRDDLYRDDYTEWGFAVSLGHLVYSTEWETETTEIDHILYGENYSISHITEYTSKLLKNLEESEKNKKNKNEF